MPQIRAYGTVFRDWEGLLGAVARNVGLLAGTEALKSALESVLAKAKDLKLQQEDLEGKRLATTQSFKQLVEDGREVARKLRAQVVATLGSKTELLKQFGIPTVQRRKGKKTSELLPEVGTPAVNIQVDPVDPTRKEGSGA